MWNHTRRLRNANREEQVNAIIECREKLDFHYRKEEDPPEMKTRTNTTVTRRSKIDSHIISPAEQVMETESHMILVNSLEKMEVKSSYTSRIFFILIFFYIGTSQTVLNYFNCRLYSPLPDGSTRKYLVVDLEISCTDTFYIIYRFFVIAMV